MLFAIELGIDPIHFGSNRNATQRHHPSRPTVADDLASVLDDYYLYISRVVVAAEYVRDALGGSVKMIKTCQGGTFLDWNLLGVKPKSADFDKNMYGQYLKLWPNLLSHYICVLLP